MNEDTCMSCVILCASAGVFIGLDEDGDPRWSRLDGRPGDVAPVFEDGPTARQAMFDWNRTLHTPIWELRCAEVHVIGDTANVDELIAHGLRDYVDDLIEPRITDGAGPWSEPRF